jgi:hypothetical protein
MTHPTTRVEEKSIEEEIKEAEDYIKSIPDTGETKKDIVQEMYSALCKEYPFFTFYYRKEDGTGAFADPSAASYMITQMMLKCQLDGYMQGQKETSQQQVQEVVERIETDMQSLRPTTFSFNPELQECFEAGFEYTQGALRQTLSTLKSKSEDNTK